MWTKKECDCIEKMMTEYAQQEKAKAHDDVWNKAVESCIEIIEINLSFDIFDSLEEMKKLKKS